MFFERMCAQGVGAGQVDEFDRTVADLHRTDVTFHGYARIVTDALPEAGQSIEERAFARIRISDHRNAGVCAPAYGNLIC
jgi:hypothetical protein